MPEPVDPQPTVADASPGPAATPPAPVPLDRRTAVRRSAVALAGAAGLLALPALTGSAAADPGGAVRLGDRNKSGDAQTRIQSGGSAATLSLLNERVRRADTIGEVDLIAPQLRLATPVPGTTRPQLPDVAAMTAGDLAAAGGLLYFGAEAGDFDVLPSQIFTSAYATYLQPVPAARATVLDTRVPPAGLPPSVDVDTAGRLLAGRRIAVDLRSLVNTSSVVPRAAVALALQVTDARTGGVVLVHEDAAGTAGVPVLSFAVLPADVTRDGRPFALPACGTAVVGLDRDDRLWLSLSATARVVVRVTGVFVADPTVVVDVPATAADASPYARRVQRQRQALRRLTTAGTRPG